MKHVQSSARLPFVQYNNIIIMSKMFFKKIALKLVHTFLVNALYMHFMKVRNCFVTAKCNIKAMFYKLNVQRATILEKWHIIRNEESDFLRCF